MRIGDLGRIGVGLILLLLVALLMTIPFAPAHAVDPEEQLKDPALERRARDISAGLRCLVCQNESIDDSDAPLAHDLRNIVRQQLVKGATNDDITDYLVARYGEFVLLKPRLHRNTLLLWLTPLILLAGGLLLAARLIRKTPATAVTTKLTPEEERELQAVLGAGGEHPTPRGSV